MTTPNLVETIREQINIKHQDALRALDVLSAYLTEATPDFSGKQTKTKVSLLQPPPPAGPDDATRVDRVLRAISTEYKTVAQLEDELKMSHVAIRVVLYSKSVRAKLAKKRVGKVFAFRLKHVPSHAGNDRISPVNGVSVAGLVREFTAKHPGGFSTKDITAALEEAVEKIGGTKAAIGAALYNFKARGELVYNESNGTYAPAASG